MTVLAKPQNIAAEAVGARDQQAAVSVRTHVIAVNRRIDGDFNHFHQGRGSIAAFEPLDGETSASRKIGESGHGQTRQVTTPLKLSSAAGRSNVFLPGRSDRRGRNANGSAIP